MRKRKHLLLGIFICFLVLVFAIPVKAALTKEVEPFADSEVSAFDPDSNHGSSNYINIGADIFGYQSEAYLKFLIPTVETEITRVYISSYWYSFMCETPLSVSASTTSASWSEYTITWNNKPARGTHLDTDSNLYDSEYFIIDISLSLITEGMILSICIYENVPYKPDGLQANSREWGYKVPVLVVEYKTPPIQIIVPIIVGVILVFAVISGIVYNQSNKKKKIRQNLENSRAVQQYRIRPTIQETKVVSNYCRNCGQKNVIPNSKFCVKCGQDL